MIRKTRSVLLTILITLTAITSCKREPRYSFQLAMENSTADNLLTRVYPKTNFPISYWRSYAYRVDEVLGEVSFNMDTFHREVCLYGCVDPNNLPEELLSEVFDSIIVLTANEKDTVVTLKFYPDTVMGYLENPYKDHEVWKYNFLSGDECTNIKCFPFEMNLHVFEIQKSKYRK